MRHDINAPRHQHNYPDRISECEAAIETRVQDTVSDAVAAGWSVAEVCAALVSVADHQLLASAANEATTHAIRSMKQSESPMPEFRIKHSDGVQKRLFRVRAATVDQAIKVVTDRCGGGGIDVVSKAEGAEPGLSPGGIIEVRAPEKLDAPSGD